MGLQGRNQGRFGPSVLHEHRDLTDVLLESRVAEAAHLLCGGDAGTQACDLGLDNLGLPVHFGRERLEPGLLASHLLLDPVDLLQANPLQLLQQLFLLLLEGLPADLHVVAIVVVVVVAITVSLIAVAGNVVVARILQVVLQLDLPSIKRASVTATAQLAKEL